MINDLRDIISRLDEIRNANTATPEGTPRGVRRLSTTLVNNPDSALASVTKQNLALYNQLYRPLNRELMGEIDSRAMIEAAKDQIETGTTPEETQQRSQRMASRFGIGGNTLDLRRSKVSSELTQALDNDDLVNNARVSQYERNKGLREELAAIGRGIATSSTDSLNTAADLSNARQNNNAAIKAQNSAQRTQTAASVASMALMAAAIFM